MAFSLVKRRALAYAFVALVIICVLASIFAMNFGLFFATIAIAIVVYAVYRMKLDENKRNANEIEQCTVEEEETGNTQSPHLHLPWFTHSQPDL